MKLCERYIILRDVALARRRVRVEWQRENVLVVFFFQCAVEVLSYPDALHFERFCILLHDYLFFVGTTLYTKENKNML